MTDVPSLKRRLTVPLTVGLAALWLFACVGSVISSIHEINEAEDSRMQQLAQTLLRLSERLPETPAIIASDNEYNGFAIWYDRTLRLADHEGSQIPFQAINAFENSHAWWHTGARRYLYQHQLNTGYTVAVSQRWQERYESMKTNIWIQLVLLLIALPMILSLMRRSINHGLQPLNILAAQLQQRSGSNLTPVSEQVPDETLPLVQSFNRLLERADIAMQRERRFSADAAHELRSPLAAIKIQTEVLAIADTAEERAYHTSQIINSLERASHLTDQLLILSRLDPMDSLPESEPLDWHTLIRQTLSLVNPQAREKHIRLKLHTHTGSLKLPSTGSPILAQLMLRNLLDNAIRYSPTHSIITITLTDTTISIIDQGKGIAHEHLARIGDRFYRPAGQTQSGSGLGLSIVKTAAALHGMKLNLINLPEGGLCAQLINIQAA